jgi:hypothetical protein
VKELPSFSSGDTLTAEKLSAIVEAIKELQTAATTNARAVLPEEPVSKLDTHRVFLAKITGAGVDGTLHTFQEQIRNGASIEDYADGTKCTDATDAGAALEINGATNVADGTYVYMMEIAGGSNAYRYQFSVGGTPGSLIPVVLYHNATDDTADTPGTATLPCSFKYDVHDPDTDEQLLENVSPVMQRAVGITIVAETGLARWKPDGTLQLWWVDEVPDTALACEEA